NSTVNVSNGNVSIVSAAGKADLAETNITAQGNITLTTPDQTNLTNGTLNSSTGAVSVTAQGGDLTLGAGNISANSTVALNSGGNITLNGATVTGHGDISLLGAGNSTARIQVLNSTLASNGGNITLDRLSTTDAEGNTVTNPNAMTVKVSNSTLNATNASSGGTNGNISIRAYNPNVNLSISAYKNTVRNNDSMIEVSGSSTLTGNNVTLHSELSGANAKGLPVLLNNTTITADNDIAITSNLSGVTNKSMSAIELRNKNTLNATAGNITISNLRTDTGTGKGVFLNGSSAGAVSLTAGKDIILNGSVGGKGGGVQVTNATLNSSGNLTLTGHSATTGTGVAVTGSTLNAASANITGSSKSGIGFSLTNTTLQGDLSDLMNVTLSSKGSGAGATNKLGSSVVN
ncbi:hypothetical protein G9D33_005097, partial [Salmonella enterica]|nr:hypothetical protein [Salmonella enterica]